jgi:G:T-mismatch repair DNA endonuclease (very short patch repair protein)
MWHAEPGRFRQDRQRLNRLTGAGWRVLLVTGADLHQPARLIDRVRAALQRSPRVHGRLTSAMTAADPW